MARSRLSSPARILVAAAVLLRAAGTAQAEPPPAALAPHRAAAAAPPAASAPGSPPAPAPSALAAAPSSPPAPAPSALAAAPGSPPAPAAPIRTAASSAPPSAPGPVVEAPAPDPDPAAEPEDAGTDGWTPGKIWSLGGLAGLYTGVGAWAYFAWYHGKPRNDSWEWNGDGLFGKDTYAGGSDKLGHFYSNHVITRSTTALLQAGGWRRLPASLIAGGLCSVFFTFVEVKDAYYYEFSTGDFAADLAGVALGILMVNRPEVDRLIDFRIDYWPTDEYIDGFKDGDVNFAEDYSGQTYLLALHLSGIPGLTESRWARWGRFVDVVGGFQSVNYKPEPDDRMAVPSQHLFFGAAVNLQAVLAEIYGEPAGRSRPRTSHRVGHAIFEYVSPPYTTLRMAEAERSKESM